MQVLRVLSASLFLGLGATGGIGAETSTATTNTGSPAASTAEDTSAKRKEKPVPATVQTPKPPAQPKKEEVATTGLDEIVVNAKSEKTVGYVATESTAGTKTSTPLLETPQAISVVTREEMDARNVTTINQAVRYTPGVLSDTAGIDNRQDGTATIRGFSADRYLDGIRVQPGTFASGQIDPFFMERVEVIHGPASVLYGQASPGGFINMVSKLPQAESASQFQAQVSNWGGGRLAFDTTGAANQDGTVLYRLMTVAEDEGTQVDFTRTQRLAIAPELTWKIDSDTTITLLTNIAYDPQSFGYNQLPLSGTYLYNPNGTMGPDFYSGDKDFDHFSRTNYLTGYLFEKKVDDVWTVNQSARYNHQDVDYALVYPNGTLAANGYTMPRTAYKWWEHLDTFDLDSHAQAKFGTGEIDHTLIGGVDFQQLYRDTLTGSAAGASLDIRNPQYSQNQPNIPITGKNHYVQDQTGIYVQDQLKWRNWSLLLAGREDWSNQVNENKLNGQHVHTDDQASTLRTGLSYLFDTVGVSPYFAYTQSFQPTAGTDFYGTSFKPTRGEQEEVGIKYQPKNFNGFFSLATYNLVQSNVTSADLLHTGYNVQAGEVTSQGLELEGHFSPVKGLNVSGGYAYLDSVYTSTTTASLLNHQQVGRPPHTFSLWGDYTFQDGWLAGFGLGSGVRYIGERPANNANSLTLGAATLFDLGVHYDFDKSFPELKGLRAAVNISNLTDKTYFSLVQDTGAYYGIRRTIEGSLTYKW